MRDATAAAFTAFWMTDSWRWCRRTMPARGSVESVGLGKTQNHPSSRPADGYFRSIASGQPDSGQVRLAVGTVQALSRLEMDSERLPTSLGQQRRSILVTLAGPDDDQALVGSRRP
jgi:hypothetical protein